MQTNAPERSSSVSPSEELKELLVGEDDEVIGVVELDDDDDDGEDDGRRGAGGTSTGVLIVNAPCFLKTARSRLTVCSRHCADSS
jgi:hypothetical protein